jgi:hypothetical protein
MWSLVYRLENRVAGGLFLAYVDIFLIHAVSTSALGPNRLPVRYVLGTKQSGCEADHAFVSLKTKANLSV